MLEMDILLKSSAFAAQYCAIRGWRYKWEILHMDSEFPFHRRWRLQNLFRFWMLRFPALPLKWYSA